MPRKRQPRPETWLCADGREIPLAKLSPSHLRSIVAMLRRRNAGRVLAEALTRSARIAAYAAQAPDGAALAAESEAEWLFHQSGQDLILAELLPIFAALLSEAERRHIKLPESTQ